MEGQKTEAVSDALEDLIRYQEEHPDWWGDQDENGIDLARLRENLQLTVAERLERMEASRRTAVALREAMLRHGTR
jgi:hypothetical protein